MAPPPPGEVLTPFDLRGQVIAGKGEGSRFTQVDWFQESLERLVGFRPYRGTLNLRLRDSESVSHLATLRARRAHVITPPSPAFCRALLFPAEVEARVKAALVMPLVPGYPGNVLELVAAVSLREALRLEDGAWVHVRVWARGAPSAPRPRVHLARESPPEE